jgi:hypothetical protein
MHLIRVELPSYTITKTFLMKLVETLSNISDAFIVEFVSIPNISESIPWLALITAVNQSKLYAVLTSTHDNKEKLINKLKQVPHNDLLTTTIINNTHFLEEVSFFQMAAIPPYGI